MRREVDETNARFANAMNLVLSVSMKASAENSSSEVADVLERCRRRIDSAV